MTQYFTPTLPVEITRLIERLKIDFQSFGASSNNASHVASLKTANAGGLSFLMDKKYLADYKNTKAGVVIVSKSLLSEGMMREDIKNIVVENAQSTFVAIVNTLYPDSDYFNLIGSGIQKSFPNANVSNEAEVGKGTIISAGAFIGRGVKIGKNCFIAPNVVITHSKIGDSCIIERNTSIGQDGFGCFRHCGKVLKVKQIGGVVIGNNVEIGANCTIDRGTIDDTIIGDYSKLDNQIQIAHNVILGECAIIAANSSIAGSTTVGKRVTIAGQAGVTGHITVGDDVIISAKSGVTKNVPDKKILAGYPATDINTWKRECIALKKLVKKKDK